MPIIANGITNGKAQKIIFFVKKDAAKHNMLKQKNPNTSVLGFHDVDFISMAWFIISPTNFLILQIAISLQKYLPRKLLMPQLLIPLLCGMETLFCHSAPDTVPHV
jgi:hypothetical protein